MAEYIESLQRLAEQFGRLEGIGKKTAMRMAFSVLELEMEEAELFAARFPSAAVSETPSPAGPSIF